MYKLSSYEYQGVKREIIEISKIRIQLALAYVGLLGVIAGIVFGKKDCTLDHYQLNVIAFFLALAYFVLSLFIENLRCHLRRLSTYLLVFFEQNNVNSENFIFETAWKKFREVEKPKTYTSHIFYSMAISFIITILVFWYSNWCELWWWKFFTLALGIISLLVLSWSILCKESEQRKEQRLIVVWAKIRNDFEKNQPSIPA